MLSAMFRMGLHTVKCASALENLGRRVRRQCLCRGCSHRVPWWMVSAPWSPQRGGPLLLLVQLAGCASNQTRPNTPSHVKHHRVWSSMRAFLAKGEVIQGVVLPTFMAHLSLASGLVLLEVVSTSCGFLLRWVVCIDNQ